MLRSASSIAAAAPPSACRGPRAGAARWRPGKAVFAAELRVELVNKTLGFGADFRDLRIVAGRRLGSDDFLCRLALFHPLRDAITNNQNHAAMRHYGGTI